MALLQMQDNSWINNTTLKIDLETYFRQGLRRTEVLSFLRRDFSQYAWSLRTLDRRLRYFGIRYNDATVSVELVKQAVKQELNGPGRLLGYRAMHKKIRLEHNLLVTRQSVYDVMYDLDPNLLKERAPTAKKKKAKGHFTSKGPNWVHSLDGHDKLMGYQNSTFPLAIYGCIDTATRKLLWLRIWVTNSDPKIIGRWYLEYLMDTHTLPNMIRLDKGTETGIMATMHAYLRRHHTDCVNPEETVLYGPSTSNQIERWWKELHERLEKYFKEHLGLLKDHGHYDPHDETDRKLLSFIMIPMIQKELDIFKDSIWNIHRIRAQKGTLLPDGIPHHMYSFPEEYGLEECGFSVGDDKLCEAAVQSGVLEVAEDFITQDFRQQCERILEHPDRIEPKDCRKAFIYLKRNFNHSDH